MKATVYTIMILLSFSSVSCVYKNQYEQMTQQNQQLSKNLGERDSTINELTEMIVKIQSDLEMLTEQKKELTKLEAKGNFGDKEKQLIESINNLMQENKQKFESLQNKLSHSNYKSSDLNRKINELNEKLAESENDVKQLNQKITGLNNNLASKDSTISRLTALNSEKDKTISELDKKLNAAYYIIGDKNTLENQNIVMKKGGFLGIFGRVEKLKPGFNKEHFTKIDIRDITHITIPEELKKVKLISTHAPGSYVLKNNNEKSSKLEITNPDAFWKSSKYLVIQES